MSLKSVYACVALLAALALAGCNQSGHNGQQNQGAAAADNSPAVATVNGQPISENTLNTFLDKRTGGQESRLSPQDRKTLLDQLVNLKVLAEEADKQGLTKKPDVQAEISIQREIMLANALVKQYLDQHPVSQADIKHAYDQRVGSMDQTEYKARHILVSSKKAAEDVINKLNHGANFAKLAEKVSTGPSAKKGGELGWFSPSDMVQPFSAAVEKLKKGEYTKAPVHTQFGWHVIELEDTRAVPKPTLTDLKPAIENQLRGQKVEAYVNQLRGAAKVDIKQPETPAAASKAMPQPATGAQAPTPASMTSPKGA